MLFPPHSQRVRNSICMHCRTTTEQEVLVVTEGCRDVTASTLLEKDPNATAGNFVNMICSLLPAAIALYKEEFILVDLSPQQVFWTGDAAKLFLPHLHRIGERKPSIDSHFHTVFVPPQARLWNWAASEYDSVYVRVLLPLPIRLLAGSSTTTYTPSATSTHSSTRIPLLPSCLPAGGCLRRPAPTRRFCHRRRTIYPLFTPCALPCTATASSTVPTSLLRSAYSTASSSRRRPCRSLLITAGLFLPPLSPLNPSLSSPHSVAACWTATMNGNSFKYLFKQSFIHRTTTWKPI